MLYLLGVLIFAFGLLASIALHEIGHLVPAKKFGVKVTGEANWVVAKAATEGNFEIKLNWSPDSAHPVAATAR